MKTLGTRLKLSLRNAYAAWLNLIPDRWLLRIRDMYVSGRDGSLQKRLAFVALKLIRYKHPDKRVSAFTIPDEPRVRLANVNSIVVRHVYWFGVSGWEGAELRAWQSFCSRATRVLEIGANVGFYTVCGAALTRGHYTAVEPHPDTIRILRRNLEINGLGRVNVVQAAVVGVKNASRMTLTVPVADQDEAPPGSFLASGGEVSSPGAASYEVEIVDADHLFSERPDLVKLDVEGYEFEILNAVKALLLRERPTIFVEVLPRSTRLQQLIAELVEANVYKLLVCAERLREVGPDELRTGGLRRLHHTRDVVLVRSDRALLPLEVPAVVTAPPEPV